MYVIATMVVYALFLLLPLLSSYKWGGIVAEWPLCHSLAKTAYLWMSELWNPSFLCMCCPSCTYYYQPAPVAFYPQFNYFCWNKDVLLCLYERELFGMDLESARRKQLVKYLWLLLCLFPCIVLSPSACCCSADSLELAKQSSFLFTDNMRPRIRPAKQARWYRVTVSSCFTFSFIYTSDPVHRSVYSSYIQMCINLTVISRTSKQ